MAVAQPVVSRTQEILDFKNPSAGRVGTNALQMHNRGLYDEYKEVVLETDPKTHKLIMMR